MVQCGQKDLTLFHSVRCTNQDLRGRGTNRDKQQLNEDPLVLICQVMCPGLLKCSEGAIVPPCHEVLTYPLISKS